MKIPSSTPPVNALNDEIENGLNQSSVGSIEPAGWLAYTLTRATTAKRTSVKTSTVRRIFCVRADSSVPFQQIHVMTAIQATPIARTAHLLSAAPSQPKS